MAQTKIDEVFEITYLSSSHGKISEDQDPRVLLVSNDLVKGSSVAKLSGKADFPYEEFFVHWNSNPVEYIKTAYFSENSISKTIDTSFIDRYEYNLTEETKEILGYTCYKTVTTVNSNTIELWHTNELPYKASPSSCGTPTSCL